MIAQSTIDAVFSQADIVEIIEQFVDLKKSGSAYKALSPFTDEKTASFHVVPSKNIYKCFSSGNGGGFIDFLQKYKGWSYPECIEWVASFYKIAVEYVEATPEQKEKAVTRDQYIKINKAASTKFVANVRALDQDHPALRQLARFDKETLTEFQIGYTSDDYKFIYKLCAEKGLVKDAEDISLVRMHQGNYYDFFQKRIIFPIHDHFGNIVAFGGRALADEKPKYLNTADTPIFNKSKLLYGFFYAQKAIRASGFAYLTEGYTDVIAFHEVGLSNTVATLGTSLTEDHVKLLSRNCKSVILVRDADQAGEKAAIRDMEMLLKEGVQVGIVELPQGKDPYDLAHDPEIDSPSDWVDKNTQDALNYFCYKIYTEAIDPIAQGEALNQIAMWLSMITDNFIREQYRKQIAKLTKLKIKDIKDREADPEPKRTNYGVKSFMRLPEGVTEEEVLRYGFYGIVEPGTMENNKTGYWFMEGPETFLQKSNFVLTPLFHKYEMEDNTRVFRIENGIMGSEIVEMPSSALISVEQFRKFLFDKGPYFFDGSKLHLDKLNKKYLYEFPKAFELRTLGWQNEGFFAFYNCVYNGKLEYYDEAGLIKHDNQFFFSPAASTIYRDVRKDDDMFENDRYLSYMESNLTMNDWMKLMHDVYGEHAYAGLPFVFIALFRDLVFKVDNNSPHLYLYGQSKSGKSKFAESLMNLFFNQMPAFQLNGGTDFAFASRLERFRNVPVFLNEFDDNVVKDEWFQMIKGAYDGEGRERGRGGSKRKTEIQKVNASLILVGQYLSTKDDNSILSRSILRTFKITYDRDNKQVEAYTHLKELEKKGLSSIVTNMLQHRGKVKDEYYTVFFDTFKRLGTIIRARKQQYEERVLRNYSSLLAMVTIFKGIYQFPWAYKDYEEWVIQEVIKMSSLIGETDILVDFWTYVSNLVDHHEIVNNREYKLAFKSQIRITKGNTDESINFPDPKHIIFIRLREVWVSYAAAKKKSGGSPIDFTSLKSYMENRDYYFGYSKAERFSQKGVAGCYVLDYTRIGIDIANEDESNYAFSSLTNSNVPIQKNPDEDLPF